MSKLKLVIGNKNYSTWSLRPWFFLKQLNIDFEEEMVWLFEDDMVAKLEKYFSNAKVPVLNEGELNVWDTHSQSSNTLLINTPRKTVGPRI